MPADVGKKKEIRSTKTEKALITAMLSLLEKHNFRKITVRDICEASLISRATFYSRFTDKYNFLKWWVIAVWPSNLFENDIYDVKEQNINQFISTYRTVIMNLFLDADSWTLDVLFDVLHFILHLNTEKTKDETTNPEYIVMSSFYIGGMIQYILWQAKNSFPMDVCTMNIYLYKVIETFHNLFNSD